jgi:hypothetical protein
MNNLKYEGYSYVGHIFQDEGMDALKALGLWAS